MDCFSSVVLSEVQLLEGKQGFPQHVYRDWLEGKHLPINSAVLSCCWNLQQRGIRNCVSCYGLYAAFRSTVLLSLLLVMFGLMSKLIEKYFTFQVLWLCHIVYKVPCGRLPCWLLKVLWTSDFSMSKCRNHVVCMDKCAVYMDVVIYCSYAMTSCLCKNTPVVFLVLLMLELYFCLFLQMKF